MIFLFVSKCNSLNLNLFVISIHILMNLTCFKILFSSLNELKYFCNSSTSLINNFSLSSHHDPNRLVRLCIGSGNNLSEVSVFIKPFLCDFKEYNDEDFKKHLPESRKVLEYFCRSIENIKSWTESAFDEVIEQAKNDLGLPMPKIGLPLRVALLGKAKSPPLNSTLYLLTKEKAIERLNSAINTIS